MRLFSIGFISVIALGTALLMLPFSVNEGVTHPGFLASLFTATSATCVTGLSVVDTATTWSLFGQIVIICMIQLGGIGFMTFAVMVAKLVRKMLSPKERMLVAMSYNLNSYADVSGILKSVAIGTAITEALGAILLFTRFVRLFPIEEAIFKSIFTSISAFCNAGFDIIGVGNPNISGMSYYAGDPLINLTLALLIIIGGIGFIVWSDLVNFATKRKRISVYSQFVLAITIILIVIGTVAFAVFEWNNPATLGAFSSVPQKLIASFFQSSTWRTAGFATMNNGSFTQGALLLGIILMFVGGASGSTAGGVKVGTLGVLLYTVWCNATGKKRAIFRSRTITTESFVRAVTVVCVQIAAVIVGVTVLIANAGVDIMSIIYEVVSAISTVGVTMGITSSLPALSKIILCCLMFFGRVGILTVALSLMRNQSGSEPNVKYPDAKMLIG